jgi:glycine/serine hydroxymethyltransferase
VSKRYRAKPSPDLVAMLRVTGNPTAILKKLAGAKVKVITYGDTATSTMKPFVSRQKWRGYDETKIVEAQAVIINQKAFEPDARAQALLEGVRIAQEDLRKAGGAYDLAQVRTLMQGVSRQAVDKRVQDGSPARAIGAAIRHCSSIGTDS